MGSSFFIILLDFLLRIILKYFGFNPATGPLIQIFCFENLSPFLISFFAYKLFFCALIVINSLGCIFLYHLQVLKLHSLLFFLFLKFF